MISPEANKSKFSFTSLISKAYNNTFGVAVSYAYIYSNSFINSTSGVCNSLFYGRFQFIHNTANNAVINILKTIPPLSGYFSYMSKVKAEQKVNIKLQDLSLEKILTPGTNGNNLLHQAAFNNDVKFIEKILIYNLDKTTNKNLISKLIMQSTNNNGFTFLDVAYANKNIAVIKKVVEIFDSSNINEKYVVEDDQIITRGSYDVWQFLERADKPVPLDITKILSFVEAQPVPPPVLPEYTLSPTIPLEYSLYSSLSLFSTPITEVFNVPMLLGKQFFDNPDHKSEQFLNLKD